MTWLDTDAYEQDLDRRWKRLIGRILKGHGARERWSFLALFHGFFIRVEPHRSLWSS